MIWIDVLLGRCTFQSTLPARGATNLRITSSSCGRFQSTLPARGATCIGTSVGRCGQFQSTLPARGATAGESDLERDRSGFNPRSPRGERPIVGIFSSTHLRFNPRSPRGERLGGLIVTRCRAAGFNPRSPRGERRDVGGYTPVHYQFQSTLPARGATSLGSSLTIGFPVSIHAPREGSDALVAFHPIHFTRFNPRSPRGERPLRVQSVSPRRAFQSTLPARGATRPRRDKVQDTRVSIHAPREGSDAQRPPSKSGKTCFNPRSPRGERRRKSIVIVSPSAFQSTLPARGAT